MPSNNIKKSIREGFQVLKEYPSFERSLKGLLLLSSIINEKNSSVINENRQFKQFILSWDSKGIYMWDMFQLYKKIKFPKLQQNFISCLSFITKLGGKLNLDTLYLLLAFDSDLSDIFLSILICHIFFLLLFISYLSFDSYLSHIFLI